MHHPNKHTHRQLYCTNTDIHTHTHTPALRIIMFHFYSISYMYPKHVQLISVYLCLSISLSLTYTHTHRVKIQSLAHTHTHTQRVKIQLLRDIIFSTLYKHISPRVHFYDKTENICSSPKNSPLPCLVRHCICCSVSGFVHTFRLKADYYNPKLTPAPASFPGSTQQRLLIGCYIATCLYDQEQPQVCG